MNIYEIDQAILECLDAETGEIIDIERLMDLQMAREQKLENVACWIKNLNAEIKSMKEEEARLADRRKVKERKVERLKQYLSDALCGEKFETARCAVAFRKTSRVEVSDMQAVVAYLETNDFQDLVTYSEPTVSKTELAKLLKEGPLPGCTLESGLSLSVK